MIVPGSVNPLMLAMGGDPLDELGVIARSVRCRKTATAYFSRTLSSNGNLTTFTIRLCGKRGDLGNAAYCGLFGAGANTGNPAPLDIVRFTVTGALEVGFGPSNASFTNLITTQLFRDPAAHLEIVIAYDATQAVAANRVKLWINGQQVTSFTTATYPAQNTATTALNVASGMTQIIGCQYFGNSGGAVFPFDGLLSSICFIDGQSLTPAAFGQFHPRTGQWRPKSKAAIRAAVAAAGGTVRNGWGANGFFLPFDDPTSVTTLGYDRSQSDTDTTGNNWTATNISLTAGATYDSMLDTPTNSYCTLNSLVQRWAFPNSVFSNGNLTVTAAGTSYSYAIGTMQVRSGRWYFEVLCATVGTYSPSVGLSDYSVQSNISTSLVEYVANGTHSGAGGLWEAFTTGDVVGVAFDVDAGAVSFYKKGVLQGTAIINSGVYYTPHLAVMGNGVVDANFGQRPFSYTPPAGFKALCTKNLPFPKIPNPKSAFVAVTDTGPNIQATLAAARAGWPSYIDIIKRRDPTAEGWRWIFSDDAANYLDSSSTAAKAVVPSFTGTAYVGYSLKVSAANGVATGRLTHVNGVADVVADGLSNNRKMVFLKNEASGTWYVYHPDLTAGKLLYLEQTAAETTDATISSVTAGGFTVAAALASGTYRWIALGEVEGFLKLGKYAGNGAADGSFVHAGASMKMLLLKEITSATYAWYLWDKQRSQYNPVSTEIYPNTSAGEATGVTLDFLSSGFKPRATDANLNASGRNYIYAAFADNPFRYANAR